MSELRPAVLGPIVGHTTATSASLWIRGQDPDDEGHRLNPKGRTVGVIVVVEEGGKELTEDTCYAAYFRLHRKDDRPGTYVLGSDVSMGASGASSFALRPDTQYVVRIGTVSVDDPDRDDVIVDDTAVVEQPPKVDRLPEPETWFDKLEKLPAVISEARFRTFPLGVQESLEFLVGSCRYPGILSGKKESDQIFGPMLTQTNAGDGDARFSLMVGDQIYADMFHKYVPVGIADTHEEFQQRYHGAFGSMNMRALLRHVPTYMILDDHEIEDNWTRDRIKSDKKRHLFNTAMRAYTNYQWSHGPRNYGKRLYYSFECSGLPFFVLDERSERMKYTEDESWWQRSSEKIKDNHLLGRPSTGAVHEKSQLELLKDWLTAQQSARDDRPKFVVSPSVFVPNNIDTVGDARDQDRSDSWPAFPATRRDLLGHIVEGEIQNVVFLSGDIHCSNVATMSFAQAGTALAIRALSATSSALYWPFPFADGDPTNYVHDSARQGNTFMIDPRTNLTMDYTAEGFTQEDNFCHLAVDWPSKTLTVRAVDADGRGIATRDVDGVKSVDTVLHFA